MGHHQVTYNTSIEHLQVTYNTSMVHLQVTYNTSLGHLQETYNTSMGHLHIGDDRTAHGGTNYHILGESTVTLAALIGFLSSVRPHMFFFKNEIC